MMLLTLLGSLPRSHNAGSLPWGLLGGSEVILDSFVILGLFSLPSLRAFQRVVLPPLVSRGQWYSTPP